LEENRVPLRRGAAAAFGDIRQRERLVRLDRNMPTNGRYVQGLQQQWDEVSRELGTLWSARSGARIARCIIVSHPGGWELRLVRGTSVLRSVVHHEQDILLTEAEAWKLSMQAGDCPLLV
jgi:hypothetical protein